MPAGLTEILISWKSKRFQTVSNEIAKSATTASNSLSSKQKKYYSKIRVEFKGSSLRQGKIIFIPSNNNSFIIIIYDLDIY